MMRFLHVHSRNDRNVSAAVVIRLLTAALLLVSAGCGLKAAPRLPGLTLPVVEDLAYQLEGADVVLTWSSPAPVSGETSGIRGFLVYRAMRPAAEVKCATCPFDYQFIAEVPLEEGDAKDKQWQIRYRETLRSGFHYAYRVRTVSRDGAKGDLCGPVSFVY